MPKAEKTTGPALNPDCVTQLHGQTYVTYAGLVDLAHQSGLCSIDTTLLQAPSSTNGGVAIVQAKINIDGREYSGLADAGAHNTSRAMQKFAVCMAETRAKARALRDALNVGMVSVEELGATGEAEVQPVDDQAEVPTPPAVDTQAAFREIIRSCRQNLNQYKLTDEQKKKLFEQHVKRFDVESAMAFLNALEAGQVDIDPAAL